MHDGLKINIIESEMTFKEITLKKDPPLKMRYLAIGINKVVCNTHDNIKDEYVFQYAILRLCCLMIIHKIHKNVHDEY